MEDAHLAVRTLHVVQSLALGFPRIRANRRSAFDSLLPHVRANQIRVTHRPLCDGVPESRICGWVHEFADLNGRSRKITGRATSGRRLRLFFRRNGGPARFHGRQLSAPAAIFLDQLHPLFRRLRRSDPALQGLFAGVHLRDLVRRDQPRSDESLTFRAPHLLLLVLRGRIHEHRRTGPEIHALRRAVNISIGRVVLHLHVLHLTLPDKVLDRERVAIRAHDVEGLLRLQS